MRVELVKPSDESTSEPLDFYYTSPGGQEEGKRGRVVLGLEHKHNKVKILQDLPLTPAICLPKRTTSM